MLKKSGITYIYTVPVRIEKKAIYCTRTYIYIYIPYLCLEHCRGVFSSTAVSIGGDVEKKPRDEKSTYLYRRLDCILENQGMMEKKPGVEK